MAFRQFALYLLATLIAGGVLAVLCYRRQMLYQTSLIQRLFWPLVVFLFGVPGWIGYRYCRRWPPLDVCPACHELAPQDQEISRLRPRISVARIERDRDLRLTAAGPAAAVVRRTAGMRYSSGRGSRSMLAPMPGTGEAGRLEPSTPMSSCIQRL